MATRNISELSEEILLFIFSHVDDIDLQSIALVNHLFRRLSSDIVLWRYFHLVRNASMIDSRLFSKLRPDRTVLVKKNIMQGVQQHQIVRGQYVNGPNQQSLFETKKRIEWLTKGARIKKTLEKRLIPPGADDTFKKIRPFDHSL